MPASGDELTLYFYPSPSGIDWRTPSRLARSVIWDRIVPNPFPLRHGIGHASIGLHCAGSPGTDILTGMTTSDQAHESGDLLRRRVGLGILFETMPGRLQTREEIEQDQRARVRRGKVDWLSIDLGPAMCARLANYLDEYIQRGYDHSYGLPLRPRYGEGGGCTAFAESFLDVAGLITPEWESAWSRDLEVPEDLIGGEYAVSVFSLIFSRRARTWWRAPGVPTREIFFWDPDLMFHWVRDTWLSEQEHPSGQYHLEHKGRAVGLRIDRTAAPVPEEPIWKQSR